MRDLSRFALFILAVLIWGQPFAVLAQESAWTISETNLRAATNTQSEVLAVIAPNTQVVATNLVHGEQISQSGTISDLWIHVIYDDIEGYVWSGHIRYVEANTRYTTQICSQCSYADLTITSMHWIGSGNEVVVTDPEDVVDLLYTVYGYDLWLGYDEGGFSLPSDAKIKYFLTFEVLENNLGGPLMYNGEYYDELIVSNDQIDLWFWYSASTGEYYVYVFMSMTTTCTTSGEHCGQHLNGVYAIPLAEMQRITNAAV
jgi:hypothetical protein